ncbi:unnamed protein product [Rotaria sp. Silwood1]|nr:unnamed protein product [Rotaria sp. Silwood1]CAF1331513.1 unnamed protein product [Rotaria sp. Silwood1]CAF3519970.1 unnamed protein product [Rotaria sp. Silwood1]CAF3577278.1 unnamed protein product [Rotaria sp. Silwood1]CAF4571906.1 unnamed protein product [Rotaria sp. Silwood1]
MQTKPLLSFDEFFDYTNYPSLSFSPNGEYLLIHTRRPLWNSSSFENSLWLYETQSQQRKLITRKLFGAYKPQWSPSGNWIVLLLDENSDINTKNTDHLLNIEQRIYLFSIDSNKLLPISIGTNIPLTITWSEDDSALYFTTLTSWSTADEDELDETEWKDVIQYRKPKTKQGSTIYRIDIDMKNQQSPAKVQIIRNVSFLIGELVFVPSEQKLILTSVVEILEKLDNSEIYSIDLQNVSSLVQLTYNEAIERDLQLSSNGKHILFQMFTLSSSNGKFNDTQLRLYSVDITNGQIERLGNDFDGNIVGYATKIDGSVYILGQWGIDVQIYSQQSSRNNSIKYLGWSGAYEFIVVSKSSNQYCSIAFIYSSLRTPKEVYCIDNIDQLTSAKAITNENGLWTQRSLPESKNFYWESDEDNRTIEGILHYPPGQFEAKNLPLFVLIHGGPYDASLNHLQSTGYFWAPLAALNGWLVLEPNYRGSTGYGDQFLSEVRYQPIIRPGIDILSGVDRLIKDGSADPNRLAIGGYSYGGILTNWLITQTTRFNAAISGAGAAEHVSCWGTMDWPIHMNYLMGGFPWEIPHVYQNSGPMYYLDRVRTPTHLVTGSNDVRVPPAQSYMLERGLHSLGVPVQLLIFQNEGHSVINSNGPWYGKIKVREELKWLQQYGHQSWMKTKK